MMYRAYLETIISGEKKIIPVFPKSKKTALFKSVDLAFKRLERLNIPGRGLVFDASTPTNDWNNAKTIAL